MEEAVFRFCLGGYEFVLWPECLGFRSIVAMTGAALIIACMRRFDFRRACALLASAALLAVVQNAVRIGLSVACSFVSYKFATTWLHDYCGYVTFFVASLVLGHIVDGLARRNMKE